ncbi:MAG: DUF2878 domain-containing protein [Candidatus Sumerlaeaceae bacterium]|nr:DUF2878 domain-containing protein [Candidatus Sumerlaeaceae bacterium]
MAVQTGTRRATLNFLLYQAGWWACVLGAAQGQLLWGPAVTALALAAHFAWVSERRGREAIFVAAAGVAGAAVELFFMASGVYRLTAAASGLWWTGLWALSLWAMFAAAYDGMLRWLHGRYGLAAVLGAVGGPLAFLAGQALGAITLNSQWLYGLLPLGATWAVLAPLLLYCGKKLRVWDR